MKYYIPHKLRIIIFSFFKILKLELLQESFGLFKCQEKAITKNDPHTTFRNLLWIYVF